MKGTIQCRKSFSHLIIYLILTILAVMCLLPFLSMVSTSFMRVRGTLPDEPIIFPDFPLYTENYIKVWMKNDFRTFFKNTVILSTVALCINLVVTTSCAYGFARFQFPGKEFLFNLLLLTMMIPTMLALIPQYTVINRMKLVNTYQGIWLLWAGTSVASNTFFYRGFFEQVPLELEESMFIDGATRLQVLRHIILPLTTPAIATQAVFAFNGYWMELFTVLTFIKSVNKRTLSVALQLFRGQHTTEFGLLFAASVIALIPVITIFIIFQKKFMTQGLTEGSLKG